MTSQFALPYYFVNQFLVMLLLSWMHMFRLLIFDRQHKKDQWVVIFNQLLGKFDSLQQRVILRAKNCDLSSWLSVMPLESHHFDLSPEEFGDALVLQYRRPLLDLPILLLPCDGCGAPFTVEHALDCHVGGLVGQPHNDVRDVVGDLAFLAWGQVTREPVVCESSNDPFSVILIADLRVHGVWQPQLDVLCDVCVVNTDAPSYCNCSPQIVLRSAEAEKKRKYVEACLARHACFMPLCFSNDGMLGTKGDSFIRCLADKLSTKWERPYRAVAGWVRSRLSCCPSCHNALCEGHANTLEIY